MKTSTNQSQYKCFRQFNKRPIGELASSSRLVEHRIAEQYFNSDSLQDRLVRTLSEDRVLPISSNA